MTNNKQQTAVEWLIENHFGGIENCTPDFRNKIKQAKEMEKERIENAFNSGYNNGGLDTCLTPKQYYEQTYGGGEQ
jgi:hypothetical protein